MSPRRILQLRNLLRRSVLAIGLLTSWRLLTMMGALSSPTPRGVLGQALLLPWAAILFLVCLMLFILRRAHLWAGIAVCALLWLSNFAFNPQAQEHAHVMPIAVLFAYMAASLLRGLSPAAEETAWEASCAIIGAAYTMAGLSKLRYSGLDWVNDHHLRVLMANTAASSEGFLGQLRAWLSQSPLFALLGSFYALAVELSGIAMLSRRLRPYYAAAILFLHLQIYLGMGILWPDQVLMVAVFGFPIERWCLKVMPKARG